MTLTNIDKEHLNKLIAIPNLKNDLKITKQFKNSNNYSKLKVLPSN